VPVKGKAWFSASTSVVLAATLALLTANACNGKGVVDVAPPPPPAAVAGPAPAASPAEPSRTAAEAVDDDLAYNPLVLTCIAIDIETRLAAMCGLHESKVFFKFDSAKLLPAAKERLEQIATCAKTGPIKGQALLVVGRTDPVGPDEYNEQLGMSRADGVGPTTAG
jgi:outer membrane protein OmpA-like peptidoglycan-associated protein